MGPLGVVIIHPFIHSSIHPDLEMNISSMCAGCQSTENRLASSASEGLKCPWPAIAIVLKLLFNEKRKAVWIVPFT